MKNLRFAAAVALSFFIAFAHGQQQAAPDQKNPRLLQSHGVNLPARLEGTWVNLDVYGYQNKMGITINEQKPDGSFTGTFWRITQDGQHCSTGYKGPADAVPMSGTFDGANFEITPLIDKFGCKDSKFYLTLTPDKKLEGRGNSWFNLKVSLSPMPCDTIDAMKGICGKDAADVGAVGTMIKR